MAGRQRVRQSWSVAVSLHRCGGGGGGGAESSCVCVVVEVCGKLWWERKKALWGAPRSKQQQQKFQPALPA